MGLAAPPAPPPAPCSLPHNSPRRRLDRCFADGIYKNATAPVCACCARAHTMLCVLPLSPVPRFCTLEFCKAGAARRGRARAAVAAARAGALCRRRHCQRRLARSGVCAGAGGAVAHASPQAPRVSLFLRTSLVSMLSAGFRFFEGCRSCVCVCWGLCLCRVCVCVPRRCFRPPLFGKVLPRRFFLRGQTCSL